MDAEVRIENNRVVLPSNPHWENTLTGETNGVEVTLERRSANGLNGWLSYAWNDSSSRIRAAPDIQRKHFPPTTISATPSTPTWRIGGRGRTSLSARMRYGSNFPIVGYIGEDATATC